MPSQTINQTPEPLNLSLRQYQEWAITFTYQQSNGTLIPLTGYTPLLQFRTSALASSSVLSLTSGSGITFNPTTAPQVQVSAPINCPPGKYEWDLRMNNANGSIFLGRGIVIVDAEVSR